MSESNDLLNNVETELSDIEFADNIEDAVCMEITEAMQRILSQVLPNSDIRHIAVRLYGGGFTHGSVRVAAGTGYVATCICSHGTELVLIHKPTPQMWRGQRTALLENKK